MAAVQSFTATAASSTQINLSWTDKSGVETGFRIERSTDNTNWSLVTTTAANATSFSDTGLTASTLYYYRIRSNSYNGTNDSAWYTASATTQASGSLSPSWTLDFSSGEPWANGTDYTYSSLRTAGTYVDSSGYIAPNTANLCLQSEDFTTTWTNTNTTETGNTVTSPDGNTTADTITESAASNSGRDIRQTVTMTITSGASYTWSVYAKAGTATVLQLTAGSGQFGTNEWANFDLANGTVGSVGTSVTGSDATITNMGSGWYRCQLTMVATSSGASAIYLCALTDNSTTAGRLHTYTVTAGNERSLYLWGAQVVTGTAPLPYSATTTSSNGIPRLTHDKNGTRLGLLVEGSATNLLQYSEDFANAYWLKSNTTIDNNGGSFWTSPANASDAVLLEQVSGTGVHNISRNFGSATTDLCVSIFAKKSTTSGVGRYVYILFRGTASDYEAATFDLDQGTVTTANVGSTYSSVGNGIEDFGNGWYRCHLRATRSSGATNIFLGLANTGSPTFSATGQSYSAANSTDGVYIWGAMYEARNGPPTSYIETPSAANVTRSADLAHVLDSSITSWGDPGALVVHFYPPGQAGTIISTDDASTAQVGIEASTTTAARAFWSSGSTSTGTIGTGVQKAVHYWNGSTSKFCINGGTVQSGTNNLTIANTDFVTLGAEATDSSNVPGTFSQYANCVIRKVEFYSGTLTDANLQTITT